MSDALNEIISRVRSASTAKDVTSKAVSTVGGLATSVGTVKGAVVTGGAVTNLSGGPH